MIKLMKLESLQPGDIIEWHVLLDYGEKVHRFLSYVGQDEGYHEFITLIDWSTKYLAANPGDRWHLIEPIDGIKLLRGSND